jgi:hypothetical protein
VDVVGATAAAGDQDAAGGVVKPLGETMVNSWLYGR